jgi:hypothetical protein
MTSFAEFLAKRDMDLLREYVSYANQLITEAEETGEAPAQLPWWRRWGKQAMKYAAPAVAGLSLMGGIQGKAHAGEKNPVDNKPVTSQMGNSDGGFQWVQGPNGWQRVPVKANAGGDPLKNFADEDSAGDMLKNFKDEPAPKLDTSKFAKLAFGVENGTLDPQEVKNSPEYQAAKAITEKGTSAQNPEPNYDAADMLVRAVLKVAPDTGGEGSPTKYNNSTPENDARVDKMMKAFSNVQKANMDTEAQLKAVKAKMQSDQERHRAWMQAADDERARHEALFGKKPVPVEQPKVTDGSDVNFPPAVMGNLNDKGELDKWLNAHDAIQKKFQQMGREFKQNPKVYDSKNPDWKTFRLYNPNLFGDEVNTAQQNAVKAHMDKEYDNANLKRILGGEKSLKPRPDDPAYQKFLKNKGL